MNAELSGAPSSTVTSSVSEVVHEEHNQAQFPSVEDVDDTFTCTIANDSFSCIIVILTLCLLASTLMIVGFYGPLSLRLGSNVSLLIKANPLLVEYLKVKQFVDPIDGPRLYGFHKDPPLDVLIASSESHTNYIPAKAQKDWKYYLNEGSQINIYASVNSPSSPSLVILVAEAEGSEGLVQWLDDPSYLQTYLSWNILHGSGMIHQVITKSSNYYVSLANLNSETVEIQLNVTVKALVYNTSKAYYNCSLAKDGCKFMISYSRGNAAVLTTSTKDASGDDWFVEVSYGPRWITYLGCIGVTTVLMFLAFHCVNNFQCILDSGTGVHYREARASLLSRQDDDLSSQASSYDCVSQDDEDICDGHAVGMLDGKLKDGETDSNILRLCAICFDAPKDSFFLPCGHCVACFACGKRIAEDGGTCPICRRSMKKVRRIFLV